MKVKSYMTLIAGALLLAGCTSTISDVSDEGTTAEPVFPAIDGKAALYIQPERAQLVRVGLDKNQVRTLVGAPHFREGMVAVREWDYLFDVGDGRPCQFKVLFDSDKRVGATYTSPQGCLH